MYKFLFITLFLVLGIHAEDINKLSLYKDIAPLLDKYCYKCHDNDTQKGDLNLQKIVSIPSTITKNIKTWEKVIEQVHTGEMPSKKPFLSHIERNRLLEWLHHQMKNIDWSKVKQAGHVTLPRLTREEYNNTVRDLLYWDVNAGSKFGEDGIGNSGFNNDRDGLFISAAQAEKYFDAAEKTINNYVNSQLPPEKIIVEAETMLITDEITQPKAWGWLVGRTQDTVYGFVPVKRAGYYELTVHAWGHKKNLTHIPLMKVLVDNQQKASVRLNSTEDQRGSYKLIIYLKEGNRQISFNGVSTKANHDEILLPTTALEKIDIFANIPLGDSAVNLCTMGQNFMALDKIELLGPLQKLPKNTPVQSSETNAKQKRSKNIPFEKEITVKKVSFEKLYKKELYKKGEKHASNFNNGAMKLQSDYNKLRLLGKDAELAKLMGALQNIERSEKNFEKNISYMKKFFKKEKAVLNKIDQFVKELKPILSAGTRIKDRVQKLIPPNEPLKGNAKTAFIKNFTQDQWAYSQDALNFEAPPETSKVFIAYPSSTLSERSAATKVIEKFIFRAFRRPAQKTDIEKLLKLYDREKRHNKSYLEALKLPLIAVLVSPKFLYRTELAPTNQQEYKLDDYQLASRLSYFLWMSMPDDELFDLAKQGKLKNPAVLKSQIQRMLQSSKLKTFSKTFGEQWLGYHELGKSKVPDEMTFPKFTESLREEMFTETEMFIHSIIYENKNMLDILHSDYTYLNENLARHYGIRGIKGTHFRKVDLGKSSVRGGVLGMGSILTSTSQPIRTSPVDRGTWVLETLMGHHLPEPPADIPPLPENAGGKEAKQSLRKILEQHRASEQCASCHNKIDPIGFGLENFDPIGRYRKNNYGRKIESQGKLPNGKTFTNPLELRKLLYENKSDFARNMSERFLSFALGRKLEYYDEPVLRKLAHSFQKSGFKAHTLIQEIVASHPFQHQNTKR